MQTPPNPITKQVPISKVPLPLRQWFWVNLKIGAFSFGGSGRLALFQDAVVDEKKWITNDEFQEILTLAQVFPGPNLVNLSAYLGRRLTTILGTVIGLLGLCVPGTALILLIPLIVNLSDTQVKWVFQGFSLGSVVVFLVFVVRLWRGLGVSRTLKFYLRVLLLSMVCLASLNHLPLIWILIFGAGAGITLEFLKE